MTTNQAKKRSKLWIGFLVALALAGCGDDKTSVDTDTTADTADTTVSDVPMDVRDVSDAAGDTTDTTDQPADLPDTSISDPYLTILSSSTDFTGLQGTKLQVKYLAPVVGSQRMPPIVEDCYFQNMSLFEWHILFLQNFPDLSELTIETYTDLVLRETTRIWWGGELRRWAAVVHPRTMELGIYSYTIYSDSAGGAGLTADAIIEVDGILKSCMPYAADQLVFVPSDPFQQNAVRQQIDALEAAQIAIVFPDQLM